MNTNANSFCSKFNSFILFLWRSFSEMSFTSQLDPTFLVLCTKIYSHFRNPSKASLHRLQSLRQKCFCIVLLRYILLVTFSSHSYRLSILSPHCTCARSVREGKNKLFYQT